MIKHIVFFDLAENAEGKNRAENARIIKEELEKLSGRIAGLRRIEVGINASEAPQDNYHLALYCEFDSFDDLNAYQVHPEHQRVAAYIAKVKTARACVDYQAG